mgnify:CR=1 FL=1
MVPGVMALLLLLFLGAPGAAQDGLTAKLLAQGGVTVMSGGETLAKLSLNAHGPEWVHADQILATAATRAVEGGKLVEGFLPVPNTDGGAIRFAETLQPTESGFRVGYRLSFVKAITLNGLQISLLLPATAFSGQRVVLHTVPPEPVEAEDEAAVEAKPQMQTVMLPARLDAGKWQLATLPALKIEIAPGTARPITITPRLPEVAESEAAKPPVFVVQDLRQWEQDVFEVRLVLVMTDEGQAMAADESLEAGLELAFADELTWQ